MTESIKEIIERTVKRLYLVTKLDEMDVINRYKFFLTKMG